MVCRGSKLTLRRRRSRREGEFRRILDANAPAKTYLSVMSPKPDLKYLLLVVKGPRSDTDWQTRREDEELSELA